MHEYCLPLYVFRASQFEAAMAIIVSTEKRESAPSPTFKLGLQFEHAHLLMDTQQSGRAVLIVKSVIEHADHLAKTMSARGMAADSNVDRRTLLKLLVHGWHCVAAWSAATSCAAADEINRAFECALTVAKGDAELLRDMAPTLYFEWGVYQAQLLQALEDKKRSPEWQAFLKLLEGKKRDIADWRSSLAKSKGRSSSGGSDAALLQLPQLIEASEKEYKLDEATQIALDEGIKSACKHACDMLANVCLRVCL